MSDTEMSSGLHRPLQQKSINVKRINEKISRRNGILKAILHGKISTIITRDAPYAQAVFFSPSVIQEISPSVIHEIQLNEIKRFGYTMERKTW